MDIVTRGEIDSRKILLRDRVSFSEGSVFAGKRSTTKMVQYRATPGDIVVSKINARKKAIGVVPRGKDIAVTIHFRSLVPSTEMVDRTFLWLALRSRFCVNQFEIHTGGVGKGEISEPCLLQIEVPLPPLPVQEKIVLRWQNVRGHVSAARRCADEVMAKVDARFYKDLGLAAPAAHDLPKVLAVPWTRLIRWGVSYNQHAQTALDLTQGKYPVVDLGSVLTLVQYGTSEKANTEGKGTPVVRMNNIKDGRLNLGDLKHIQLSAKECSNLLLEHDDILINRTNSKELVGKCAVFHEDAEYVFASYLIRLRADPVQADFIGQDHALGERGANSEQCRFDLMGV